MASAKQIPPGGEGAISVTFSTKNRRGKNTKQIKVTSNDPRRPVVQLQVSAALEAIVAFEPPVANLGAVRRDEGVVQRIRLTGRDAATTRIVSVKPLGRGTGPIPLEDILDVRVVQEDGDGVPALEISVKPGSKPTPLRGLYLVATDHPEVRSLRLSVTGRIRGALDWQPERVYFTNLEPGRPQHRTVVVSGTEASAREVTGVVPGHPSLRAKIDRLDNGDTKVVVTCTGHIDKNVESATLSIRTSDPEVPVIDVPVSLRRRQVPVSRP